MRRGKSVKILTDEEMVESSRRLSTRKSSTPVPLSPIVKASLRRQSEMLRRGSCEKFRKAAQKVITQQRIQQHSPQLDRAPAAPFGPASRYQRVRKLLDPIKHRHLLGESTEGFTKTGAVKRRAGTGSSSSSSPAPTPVVRRRSRLAAEGEKVNLPSGEEVAELPEEMQMTLYGVAQETIRRLFYPRLCLVNARKKRQIQTTQRAVHATRPTVEGMRKNRIFAEWSSEALTLVSNAVTYQHYSPGEIILYEREPPGAGIFFLTLGSAQLLRREDRFKDKRLVPNVSASVMATVFSPTIFGATSYLSNEPRLNAVRATSHCDVWILQREWFEQCAQTLSPEAIAAIEAKVHTKRIQNLPLLYPLNVSAMRQYPLFEQSKTEFLEALISKMQPLAVTGGYVFCREDEPVTHTLVIRFGTVHVLRTIKGIDTHIKTVHGPCLLNGEAMLHGSSSSDTLISVDGCDVYTLSLESFEHIMNQPQFAEEKKELLAESRRKHMRQLSHAQVRFRPLMYQIPVLKQLLGVDHLNSLSYLFEGHLYPHFALIASASDMCDRLIIVTKGKVSLGKKGGWFVGEAGGFTCGVPHRWSCAAVALEPVECIELSRDLLIAFLKDCGVFDEYRRVVDALLFPSPPKPKTKARMLAARLRSSASDSTALDITAESTATFDEYCGHQRTAAMFPISLRGEHNATDQGFTPVQSGSSASSLAFYEEPTCGGEGEEDDEHTAMRRKPPKNAVPVSGEYGHLLPKSLPLLAGGQGASLPTDERVKIAARVASEFDPVHQRRLVQVTRYLWVKQKPS